MTSYAIPGDLNAVAAVSPTNAWAVGSTDAEIPGIVIAHWNGTRWSQAKTTPVEGWLSALAVVSPKDIWAVGTAGPHQPYANQVLIMHWNGTTWAVQKNVPHVSGTGLSAVAAIGDDVWAVGGAYRFAGSGQTPYSLHLVGGHWYVVPASNADGSLSGVVMTGRSSAWAIGNTNKLPFLLRWNGTVWKSSSFPLRATGNGLIAAAAGPDGKIWVVGARNNSAFTNSAPISMLWSGSTWRKVPVTAPADSILDDVAFVPGGNVWAVGSPGGDRAPLILRWTGEHWVRTPAPNPSSNTDYVSVGAVSGTSARDAWAAVTDGTKTFLLHWNGKVWS
jgi:hypothetical protein